jgi:5-hydroxyisourate hydrolase-like protein (transthyretin family)
MPRTRLRPALALVCVLTICCGTLAWAGWTSGAQGSAGTRTARVPAPATLQAAPVSRGADVSWSAVEVSGQAVTGYEVYRRHQATGTTVPATGGCAGVVAATSCRDTGVEPGTWTFTVRARFGGWTGTASQASNAVVVEGDVEATLDVSPRTAAPGDDLTVTGAGWAAGEQVRIEVGGVTMCRLDADDDGDLSGACELPGRAHGSHEVRALGSVTVVTAGSVSVRHALRQVSPTVTAGAKVAFRPRGFAAAAPLQVRLGAQSLGTVTTTSDGETALTSLAVPGSTPEGTYELAVSDPAGHEATAPVEVVSASVDVTPAAGAPGSEVTVSGTGWPEAAQSVRVEVGTTYMCDVDPDAAGTISQTCTVPDVQGGARELSASNGVAVARDAFDVLATVSPSTPTTNAGSALRLAGRGLTGAGQPVSVTIGGQTVSPTTPASVTTTGRVTVDVVVPELASGPQEVRVTDANGRSASTTVTVTAPEIVLSTSSGSPGDTFRVSGTHWPASVQLSLTIDGSSQCSFTTSADGSFAPQDCSVPNLPGGAHTLRVAGGGAGLTLPGGFTVLPRVALDPVRVTVGQSASVTAAGLAASSAVVVAVDGVQVATGTTSSSGRLGSTAFTVPELTVGAHTVRVTDAAGGSATAELTVFAPELTFSTTTGSPDDTFQVSGTSWPPSISVSLSFTGSQQCSFTTRADGAFGPTACTVPTSPGGSYTIRVTGGGASVTIPNGFTILPRLSLSPTRATAGQTASLLAVGLAASSDVVISIDGTQVGTARTTTTGRLSSITYTVPDLTTGTHTVRVTDAAGGTATAELTVFAPDLTFSTRSGAPDDIFQLSGASWPATTSIAIYVAGSQQCGGTSRADGTFGPIACSVPGIPGGTHPVRVTGGGASVTIADGFTIVPRILLDQPRVTAGQAASLVAAGLAATSDVTISIDGTQVATARTNVNGRLARTTYTVPDLAAGTHTVRATDATGGSATADLTVLAPELTLSRSSASPDELIQVSGQRWPASSTVALSLGASQPCSFVTRADGSFGPSACSVPGVPGGAYVVRGTSGGLVHTMTVPFTVVPQVSTTPQRVAPGQQVTVNASGLAGTSDTVVRFGEVVLGTVRTTSNGRLGSPVFTVPTVPAGSYAVEVTDAVGGTATTAVTVHTPTVHLSTTSGAPQSTFEVTGQGWPASASVEVKLGSSSACSVQADASGALPATACTVPNVAGAAHNVVASGGGPSITMPGAFTVTPRVTVTPLDASPGQQVSVSGSGLPAASDVRFTIGGVEVGTARTGTSGLTSSQLVTVPDLPAGPTGVQVVGTAGPSAEVVLQVRRPTLVVQPVHRAGDSLQVTGTGWRPNATVGLWLGGTNFCSLTTGAAGALDATCNVTSLPGGPDQVLAGVNGSVRATTTLSVLSSLSLASPSVPAGSLFTYTARGLRTDRDAQLLIGGVVVATFRPGTQGSWNASVRMPAGTPAGQTQVVLRQDAMADATATITVT